MENIPVLYHTRTKSVPSPLLAKRKTPCSRPRSYLAAINNSVLVANTSTCFELPKELWLIILVNYGLTAKDLASLAMTCKWQCWGDFNLIEEAARLIIKRHKKRRFGELTNRLNAVSWKERLHTINQIEMNSCLLAAGSYQNIAITEDRQALSWGAGKFGQLGNGISGDQVEPQKVCLPSHTTQIVQVSAGCGHTGLLTDEGDVYVCGDNRYCQLGLPKTGHGQHLLTPTKIDLGDIHVVQVACGSSHTLFLSDTGRVYSVGHGDSGQLGLGPHIKTTSTPTCIPLPYDEFNFVFIAAGIAHTILLTECGKAFTCGLGSAGQLGHGGTKNLSTLAQVTAIVRDRKIVYATASDCHTIFIDSKGVAYSCGRGNGMLGHGDTTIRTTPKRIESLENVPIVTAAAGVGRSVFISEDGQGYWCGEGMGHRRNVVTSVPTIIPDIHEPLLAAAIGNSHIVLKTKSGRFMSSGNNGRLQTGHITTDQSPVLNYTYIPNL